MTLMNTTGRALLGSLSLAAVMTAIAAPARAQDEVVVVEPVRATMYLNGGVGKGEEQYMHKTAKDWPLRMIFSERKDNEFIANVNLLVTDTQGTPYLTLQGAGPMTYAMLPAGKYRITADFNGKSERHEVTLDGKSGRDVFFHWKGSAKIDPWDGKPMGGKEIPG
jgi:hypothetical protein